MGASWVPPIGTHLGWPSGIDAKAASDQHDHQGSNCGEARRVAKGVFQLMPRWAEVSRGYATGAFSGGVPASQILWPQMLEMTQA